MDEDMNKDLDELIANFQADYFIEHPEAMNVSKTNPEYLAIKGDYYNYIANSLMWASEYLFKVGEAYQRAREKLILEQTPTQERINKIFRIK